MPRYEDADFKKAMRVGLDFNRALDKRVGEGKGLSGTALEAVAPRMATVVQDLLSQRSRGKVGFMDQPYQRAAVEATLQVAEKLRRFDTLVVFGIGGSSLGGQMLVQALTPPFREMLPRTEREVPRVLFCDNVDPDTMDALLAQIDLRESAFAVVTKSGGTAETMAQFWLIRDRLTRELGLEGYRERVVGITDPEQGRLRQVGAGDGITLLPVPPAVGGRYSVLTPVGLLPAAVAGIDIEELLAGAAAMEQRCRESSLWQNPAAAFAAFCYLMDTQLHRPILVLWAYADGLRKFTQWFVQLWAESLGKRLSLENQPVEVGPTPVPAVGAVDQHAQGQLFMEGPPDKFITFLRVRTFGRQVVLPALADYRDQEDVIYLAGKDLGGLLDAEYLATAVALADAGRPSCTIELPALNPFTLGGTIMLLECACALAGGLYRIDPFNQPGVEEGKRLTYALMGRAGYESLARRITAETGAEARFRF